MKEEEYKKSIEAEKDKHKKAIRAIGYAYAMENNTVKVGDIIEDSCSKILVEKIMWGYKYFSDIPQCIYSGVKLTKQNKPYKSGEIDTIYQSNII